MFKDWIDDLDDHFEEPDDFLDVPFVPTDDRVVKAMLNLAGVRPSDVLYDLGSGDGRIVVAAARDRDARAVGIEIDPQRISEAIEYAEDFQVESQVSFIEENIFTADISAATVVTLYLLQSINVELRPRLLSQLRPGTRIVSHAFDMGDWKADKQLQLSGIDIYKWVVPAQIAGTWDWQGSDDTSYRAELKQEYQNVTGRVWRADKEAELQSVTLRGEYLELRIRASNSDSLNNFTLKIENNELRSVFDWT